ncbi:hypothetical protein D3C78_1465420 [compost metagenome]
MSLMFDKVTAGNLVKQLDQDRETNCGIQVTFRNMQTKAFGDQAKADHQQEAQAQHHNSRMRINEVGQRFGSHQHHHHGDDNGGHHNRQVVHHAHGGNYRVE